MYAETHDSVQLIYLSSKLSKVKQIALSLKGSFNEFKKPPKPIQIDRSEHFFLVFFFFNFFFEWWNLLYSIENLNKTRFRQSKQIAANILINCDDTKFKWLKMKWSQHIDAIYIATSRVVMNVQILTNSCLVCVSSIEVQTTRSLEKRLKKVKSKLCFPEELFLYLLNKVFSNISWLCMVFFSWLSFRI